jgi:hypothetical protein
MWYHDGLSQHGNMLALQACVCFLPAQTIITVTLLVGWRCVMRKKGEHLPKPWSMADAIEMYGIRDWGNKYFNISDNGHVLVTPPGS